MKGCNRTQELFQERTEYVFALPLPKVLRALLDYYEYLVAFDFNLKSNTLMETKKNQRNLLSEEHVGAIKKMTKRKLQKAIYIMPRGQFPHQQQV